MALPEPNDTIFVISDLSSAHSSILAPTSLHPTNKNASLRGPTEDQTEHHFNAKTYKKVDWGLLLGYTKPPPTTFLQKSFAWPFKYHIFDPRTKTHYQRGFE